ncbi:MAG: branched-chain amino acid ABC transporter permease [Chloroflexi bacterium RBG_16_57_11]|nr:MAG: branched-chain amino acid ABC transporter permease [Chloroflexi bacterium RBG_16_57_11]
MSFWWVMIIAGLATFAIRATFILLIGQREIPPLLRRALYFIPPAVLTAIILPELVLPRGQLNLSLTNPNLLAGIVAVLVAWRTRSVLLTILVGMAVFWAARMVIGS